MKNFLTIILLVEVFTSLRLGVDFIYFSDLLNTHLESLPECLIF